MKIYASSSTDRPDTRQEKALFSQSVVSVDKNPDAAAVSPQFVAALKSRPGKATVIAGYPGVGKSHFTSNAPRNLKVVDSDSTRFSKLEDGKTANPAWPDNYITHIKEKIDEAKIVFVSTHETTRQLLKENNIDFTIVYPDRDLKSEYMDRYKQRGTPAFLLKILDENWNKFTGQCAQTTHCNRVELEAGEHMGDVINMLQGSLAEKEPEGNPVTVTTIAKYMDAAELHIEGKTFANIRELAFYAVNETPVYGIHESVHKDRSLESLETDKSNKMAETILDNMGIEFK